MKSAHPLEAYLRRNDVDASELATKMNVSRVTLWRWAHRKSGIKLQKALKLERITEGAVRPSDFAAQ
jgi:transcriptional regulator with XRE-family HTH domain